MINKLTQNQIDLFPEYVDKWIKIGTSVKQISLEEAQSISDGILINILKQDLKPVILCDSPLSAWLCVCMFSSGDIWNSVMNSVGDSVENSVRNSVENSVGDSVENSVENSIWNSIWNSVMNSVGDSVENSVRNSVENSVGDFIWPYIDGCFFSSWFSFYDYMNKVLNIKLCKEYFILEKSINFQLYYPLNDVVIISNMPNELFLNSNNVLHADLKPAIKYNDGFEIYALNNVRVPKEIVMTPADQLDCKLVLKEKNVEVRREIIRKIGIEKVVKDLGAKSVDKSDNYELLNFDIIDSRFRPYLKMLNPSIDTWHIEGVHPECDTIEKALAWRDSEQTYETPVILT